MTARKNIMLGTAGHVDHGKTALVKLLTGCDTDTLTEEKERGLTIDLGFAPCRLSDRRVVGIVDVPGHVDFIRNMVAGAHGIDVVILVVAADDGIMPQTREHLHILTLMGLRHGLVALTKVDLVEESRRQLVVQELRRLLANTFLADAPICPLSNLTGEGYGEFYETLNEVVAACESRPCRGWFRVWVEDVFTIRGAGTVVTGIPTHGRVRPGDALTLLPTGQSARVRRLQVYGEDATEGRAGECVALNVPELDHDAVRRGMALCAGDAFEPGSLLEAEIRALETLPSPIKDGTELQLHVGTASVLARLALLETRHLDPGARVWAQLRLVEPLALAPGERFVLRANVAAGGHRGLTTIGGGRVLGTGNVRLRRQKPWTLARLRARHEALDDAARWAELMVREGPAPLRRTDLARRCLLRPDEADGLVAELRSTCRLVEVAGGAFAHPAAVEELAARSVEVVRSYHATQPQHAGVARDALAKAVGGNAELLALAFDSLIASGRLTDNGTVLACPGWRPRVSDPDQAMSEQVAASFRQACWAPPTLDELGARLGIPASRAASLVQLLLGRGELVRLDERVVMHRDAVEAGKQAALALFRRTASFTTMAFRDALGVSRKFAVPLLDHLDRSRVTVRSGHDRTPGAEAKRQLASHES